MSQEPKSVVTPDQELLALEKERVRRQIEREDLQYRRDKRLEDEQLEQESIKMAARKQNAENAELARKKQEQAQAMCGHTKPSGKSAIMGQKVHTGPNRKYLFTFVCGFCNKEFNEYTVPPMLRPPAELVGGPDV